MACVTWENSAVTVRPSGEWTDPRAYRLRILITKDDETTYSAVALNLPGAGSCGATEDEAMENAKEAIRGILESYEGAAQEIPWKEPSSEDIPFGAKQKVIIVHV